MFGARGQISKRFGCCGMTLLQPRQKDQSQQRPRQRPRPPPPAPALSLAEPCPRSRQTPAPRGHVGFAGRHTHSVGRVSTCPLDRAVWLSCRLAQVGTFGFSAQSLRKQRETTTQLTTSPRTMNNHAMMLKSCESPWSVRTVSVSSRRSWHAAPSIAKSIAIISQRVMLTLTLGKESPEPKSTLRAAN